MSTRSSPFYILFSHSTLSPAPSNTLGHPTTQYHYADDSPLNLLPQPQEHVLLLDFQPDSNSLPPVRSISKAVAVTGIKVDEGIVAAPVDGRNEKMYIIETTSLDDPQRQDTPELTMKSPRDVLAEFKSKNAILRRALHYPDSSPGQKVDTTSTLSPTSPLPISPLQ